MDELPKQNKRATSRRRKVRDEEADMRRSVNEFLKIQPDTVSIPNKSKTKSSISVAELQNANIAFIDDTVEIEVLCVHGHEINKQFAAVGCCCNLDFGDSEGAGVAVAKAAGPYLVSALDNLTTEVGDEGQLFGPSLAEALPVDSGSEADEDENLTLEELQQLMQDDEEDGEEDAPLNNEEYLWDDNFTTFRGERSAFREEVGPKIEGTRPLDLFTQIWDLPIMNTIVDETNRYAQRTIDTAVETDTLHPTSRLNAWVETSSEEIYRLMGIMILMGICVRSRIDEYWTTGKLGMPGFRSLMSLQRFWLLMKFLHFADNDYLSPTMHGEERKLFKINSVLAHLNSKFQSIYTPRKELSIDESLLLWKGRLSWVQCIRSKAARFGIKTYELCEAITGYCLKTILYTGKTASTKPIFGFTDSTAKTVLTLMGGYLGKGYTLFMDNFYNSVSLARFLKSKMTDVVGTLNRRRAGTPQVIKDIDEKRVPRGQVISVHCGDVAVTSWKDVKLVTTLSTYHQNETTCRPRAGIECTKPVVVHDYNQYMGGVDLKDQKLSMYLLERKRGLKWYIKVFRRLLNVSIMNAHIIQCANAELSQQKKMSHRQFRYALAEDLFFRYGAKTVPRQGGSGLRSIRLELSLGHFPEQRDTETERTSNKQEKVKRGRCVRCAAKKVRKTTTIVCCLCDVFLCVGECFRDYHTLEDL